MNRQKTRSEVDAQAKNKLMKVAQEEQQFNRDQREGMLRKKLFKIIFSFSPFFY